MSGPRFAFRLQPVLEMRERAEQAVAARVATATRQADDARAAHDALAAVRAAGAEAIQRSHGAAPSVGELRAFGTVLARLDAQLDASGQAVASAEAHVADEQQQLNLAFQARRVIDRLKEKAQGEWQAELAQADRRLMDELALMRFAQRTPPSGTDAVADTQETT